MSEFDRSHIFLCAFMAGLLGSGIRSMILAGFGISIALIGSSVIRYLTELRD